MTDVKITVRDDGNLRIDGPTTPVDATGAAFELGPGKPEFLCHCGRSASKPFGDSTHRTVGFKSAPRAMSEGR